MRALKGLIIRHHWTPKYLIPIDDFLQTFKEFKVVQNSLNFVQGIESLLIIIINYAQIETGLFYNIKGGYKLK